MKLELIDEQLSNRYFRRRCLDVMGATHKVVNTRTLIEFDILDVVRIYSEYKDYETGVNK